MVHTLFSWIPAFTPLSCGPFSLRIRIPNSMIASTASGGDSISSYAHTPLPHSYVTNPTYIFSSVAPSENSILRHC